MMSTWTDLLNSWEFYMYLTRAAIDYVPRTKNETCLSHEIVCKVQIQSSIPH